eukprot:TRINITY_DN17006_c0_g1_i1.p1 TRINITY_DN17006_c0_g1~~TRINITY_DN17006_c0_g1_i1.p1  ORF type:complete len:455 (-),score=76.33 TRINITY_DN17006_c0_g1_i1:163-1413(-)
MRRPITPFVAQVVPQGTNLFNCQPIKANLTGKIALVAFGNCSIERHIQYVLKAGAKGMLLISDGWRVCNLIDEHTFNTSIPTICVNAIAPSFRSFVSNFTKNGQQLKATLIDFTPGENPYDELNRGGMQFRRAIMLFLCPLLMIYSLYKMYLFSKQKNSLNIFISLISAFLYATVLMIYNIDNQAYFRVITNFQFQVVFNNMKYIMFSPSQTVISIVHTGVILKVFGNNSNKKIIPITVLILFMLMVEIPLLVSAITFSTYRRNDNLFRAISICISIFYGFNVLFYWLGSILLIYKLHSTTDGMSNTQKSRKIRKYLKFSILVIIYGILIFSAFMCINFSVNPNILNDMYKFTILYYMIDCFLLLAAFVMVYMFQPKHSPFSQSLTAATNSPNFSSKLGSSRKSDFIDEEKSVPLN